MSGDLWPIVVRVGLAMAGLVLLLRAVRRDLFQKRTQRDDSPALVRETRIVRLRRWRIRFFLAALACSLPLAVLTWRHASFSSIRAVLLVAAACGVVFLALSAVVGFLEGVSEVRRR